MRVLIEIRAVSSSDKFGENYSDANGFFGYIALENGHEVGSCLFKLEDYSVIIIKISTDNSDKTVIEEGLIRASLNFAANRGAYIASISDNKVSETAEKIGFRYKDDILQAEIPDILLGGCDGCCATKK